MRSGRLPARPARTGSGVRGPEPEAGFMAVHRDSWQVVERTCLSVSWRWDDPLKSQVPAGRSCQLKPLACLLGSASTLCPKPVCPSLHPLTCGKSPSILHRKPLLSGSCLQSQPHSQPASFGAQSHFSKMQGGAPAPVFNTQGCFCTPPPHSSTYPPTAQPYHACSQTGRVVTHTHTHSSCLLTPGNSYPSLNTRVDVPMHSLP